MSANLKRNTSLHLKFFKNADGYLIAAFGFLLIWMFTRHGGIGISPDSIAYVSVARNFNASGRLVDYNMGPLVDFPVFYPFFLSVAGFITRADQVALAPYLNGFLFAAVIVITGYLIDSFEGLSKVYKWTVLLLIAFSPSLLEIYTMLWSETLFLLFTIIFIAAFARYLRRRTLGSLLLCGVIAALACITRYASVTIIGTGLMLLVFDRSLSWQKRLEQCLIFGCTSVTLLIANLVCNALITGSLTGPRQKGILLLSDNIVFYGRVLCDWLPVPGDPARLVSGIAIVIFAVLTLLFLRRSFFGNAYATAENCFTAFFIVYTVFIIGISTLSHFEQINNRFLSPLYIPMLLALTSWIPGSVKRLNGILSPVTAIVLVLAVLLFGRNQYLQAAEMYDDAKTHGVPGYTEDSWKSSQTAQFLRRHPGYFDPSYTIYSNAHEAAYFNGGLRTESTPQRVNKNETREFFEEDGFYLIWFDNFSDNELIKFRTIWDNADVVKQIDFNDGDIFFVKPRHRRK